MDIINLIMGCKNKENLVRDILMYAYNEDIEEIYLKIEKEFKSIDLKLEGMFKTRKRTRIELKPLYIPIGTIITSSQLIAYLLKLSFLNYKDSTVFIYLLEDFLKTLYLPGILKFYFKQLSSFKTKNEHRKMIINNIAFLLLNNKVDEVGVRHIFEYLYVNRSKDFVILYFILLNSKHDRFFREQLILNDIDIDYVIGTDTSLETIDKLLKINKFEYKDDVYQTLKSSYYENNSFHDNSLLKNILVNIQERYIDVIQEPIPELLPIIDSNTKLVLASENKSMIETYLKRVEIINLDITVWYLVNNSISCKEKEIRKYINDNYEDILDYIFIKITNILDRSSKTGEKDCLNVEDKRSSSEVQLASEKNYSLNDILICSINLTRYITYGVEDVVKLYLKIIDTYKDKDIVYRVLVFIHSIIRKLNFDYNNLKEIFYRIVFLDYDCAVLRSIKYKIINEIIIFYYHNTEVTEESDKRFPLEMIADLWEEVSLEYEIQELESFLILLTSIINITKKFYLKRMLSSCLIDTLLNDHKIKDFNETRRKRYLAFLNFLSSISSLDLPKEYFEKILMYVIPFYRIFDTKSILDLLIEADPYYFFYLIFENNAKFSNDFILYAKTKLVKKLSSR